MSVAGLSDVDTDGITNGQILVKIVVQTNLKQVIKEPVAEAIVILSLQILV